MTTFFDEVRAIVLNKGTKKSKIEKLQSDLKITAYEANAYYMQLQPLMSLMQAQMPEGKLRFTVGVEIECFNIDKSQILAALERRGIAAIATGYNHTDSNVHYKLGHDGSIDGNNPCEVVSPVLKNLKSLKDVCEVINEAGAQVNRSCGLHVHFGAEKFTVEQWCRIIDNYASIESIIDSFMPVSRRENNNRYCGSIVGDSVRLKIAKRNGDIQSVDDIATLFYTRYKKLNVMAYRSHKTIEFRQHSGTTDFEKISNWVDFLARFIDWSLKHEERIVATSILTLPFLTDKLRNFYAKRANELCA